MPKHATPIALDPEDRKVLEGRVRARTTPARDLMRARIILMAAQGMDNMAIAQQVGTRPATVSAWRLRFAREGLEGLQDRPRPGRPRRYDAMTQQRILRQLDEPPPKGFSHWNGRLLAEALQDVAPRQVWRVLQGQGISLQRRRSWCISTDPQFAQKAADIIGLYLAPPENAVVICVDEKPHIQALERAQGWLKLPNGKALSGFSHEYKRHGTTTLFAALQVATGQVKAGHYKRRRRREFLDFMNEVVADYAPDVQLHVVLDNLNTHKPKHDRWLGRHRNVHLHFTPTHASWLNQVETWFSILWRQALRGLSATSPRQVREAIDAFIAAYQATAAPFEWRKRMVHPVPPKNTYADLCH